MAPIVSSEENAALNQHYPVNITPNLGLSIRISDSATTPDRLYKF